ncbi:hypothetical protein N9K16_06235 [Alphaproteobacteria bacterium]|nr:hypothetical protein [Alphaproteobacteria bacterium]
MIWAAVNWWHLCALCLTFFGWSRSKVDRFLKRLEEGQRISRCVSTKGRKSQTIRLLNYESFYGQNDTTETMLSPLMRQKRDSLKKEESNKLNQSKHYGTATSALPSSSLEMADLQKIADHCLQISNLEAVAKFAPGFHDLSPIAAWLKAGADPEEDLYPLFQGGRCRKNPACPLVLDAFAVTFGCHVA